MYQGQLLPLAAVCLHTFLSHCGSRSTSSRMFLVFFGGLIVRTKSSWIHLIYLEELGLHYSFSETY